MKMKKISLGIVFVFSFILLVGCGKQVTQKDLMRNKWEVVDTTDKDLAATALATFSKTTMTISFEVNGNETSASDELGQWGEKLGKQMLSEMTFEVPYEINEGVIHLENKNLGLDTDFNVKRDNKKIIFTNEDTKANMVLSPYDK